MAGPGFYSDLSVITNVNEAVNQAQNFATQSAASATASEASRQGTVATGNQILADTTAQKDLAVAARLQAQAAQTEATNQQTIATQQATIATNQATQAGIYAQAAGAAAGSVTIVGKGRKFLRVKANETGVEWQDAFEIGEGYRTSLTSSPSSNYLIADGSSYSQSAYPELFSKIGFLLDIDKNPLSAPSQGGQYFVPQAGGTSTVWSAELFKGYVCLGTNYGIIRGPADYSTAPVQLSSYPGYLTASPNILLVVNSTGTYYRSTDAINFTTGTIDTPLSVWQYGVTYAGGYFFVTGQATVNSVTYQRIFRSADGITWTKVYEETGLNYIFKIDGTSSLLFACRTGSSTVLKSADGGATWTSISAPQAMGHQCYVGNNAWMFCPYIPSGTNGTDKFYWFDGNSTWTVQALPGLNAVSNEDVQSCKAAFGYGYFSTRFGGLVYARPDISPVVLRRSSGTTGYQQIVINTNEVYGNISRFTAVSTTIYRDGTGNMMSYNPTTSYVLPMDSVKTSSGYTMRTILRAK